MIVYDLPGDSNVGIGLHSTVEKQVASPPYTHIAQLLGEEWRHVSVQPVVHNHCEVAGNDTVLVESFHAVLATVVNSDVVYLYMLVVALVVNVRIVYKR